MEPTQVVRPQIVLTRRDDMNIDIQTTGVSSPTAMCAMLAQVLAWALSEEQRAQEARVHAVQVPTLFMPGFDGRKH